MSFPLDSLGVAAEHKPQPQSSPVTHSQEQGEVQADSKWAAALGKDPRIWERLSTDFGLFQKSNEAKFGKMVMNGIPDGLRSRVWQLMIDPDGPQKDSHFFKRVQPAPEAIRTAIRQALDQVPISQAEKPRLQEPVYRVLYAYIACDAQLGYVPGMEIYPALLLSKMDEDRAFRCFYRLMRGPKHSLREFFINDFAKLRSFNVVWDNIIRAKFPKIHANLKRLGIDHTAYTSRWFSTACLTLPFPPDFKLRIFDRYAAFGARVLLSLGLAMMEKMKSPLETSDSATVQSLLLNPVMHLRLQDYRSLVHKWDNAMMSEDDYRKLMKRTGLCSADGP
jgi:hypothetical protein